MVILQLYPLLMAGTLPRPLVIHPEFLRHPARCVRAGPSRPWCCQDSHPSRQPRTVTAPRAPCP